VRQTSPCSVLRCTISHHCETFPLLHPSIHRDYAPESESSYGRLDLELSSYLRQCFAMLAIFLKRLGFQPVTYERAMQFGDAWLWLRLRLLFNRSSSPSEFSTSRFTDMRKGLQPKSSHFSQYIRGDPGQKMSFLGENGVPRQRARRVWAIQCGAYDARSCLQHLVDTAEIQGISIHWDHHLVDIELEWPWRQCYFCERVYRYR
jgi:hypothetical protein